LNKNCNEFESWEAAEKEKSFCFVILNFESENMPPKYYADVCQQMAQSVPDYSDYESFEVKFQ